ncbi:MAG: PSD1 and planctomycete cytochrome C domain-containing protein [Bryobacterales bacterium]
MRFLAASLSLLVLLPAARADLASEAYQILEKNCHACHGAAVQMSKLDLRTRDRTLQGGERGPAVEPANLDRSFLWRFVTHQQKPEMPPGSKLSDADIETLRKWIIAGAPFPEVGETDEEAARLSALKKLEDRPITKEERSWWAFVHPVRSEPPVATQNPIDGFLLAKLQEKGVKPNEQADKRTLIRRIYLDMLGLPPTPEQVNAYLADNSPNAWEKVVDALLASPHYGERWGRHWLDLVHYADSGGYERDFDWPTMWRYRDYVIKAFNEDKPYDRFILEQIAGDEIDPGNPEAHIATGYLRMVLDNNIKDERTRMDELDDNVSTTALTFLGMTVGCARCHNHKFDPIPQKDYYQMQAVFFSTKEQDYPLVSKEEVAKYDAAVQAIKDSIKPLEDKIDALEKPYRDQLFEEKLDALPPYYRKAWETAAAERTEGQRLNARQVKALYKQIKLEEVLERMSADETKQREELERQIAQLNDQRPEKYATARTVTEESAEPLPSYFLHRGDPGSKGSVMDAGVLTVAEWQPVHFKEAPKTAETSHRREQFARWIASEKNPLTARVMVNRLWQHHFGEGIVRSTSNFGKTGEAPSHPELLDWLATEFVRSGWSVKHMHRLMLTSEAYKRSANDSETGLAKDQENRLFWRAPRQRLEAEILRDSILQVAGTLDLAVGGEAVRPYINPDLIQSSTGRRWDGADIGDPETWRRSVYVFQKRSIRFPMFEAFDQPDMVGHCAARTESTVAPQALLLMNNAAIFRQAKFLAQRLELEAGSDPGKQVERAFELALARPPRAHEKEEAVSFIRNNPTGLVDFCQTMFNLNEFVYRQ